MSSLSAAVTTPRSLLRKYAKRTNKADEKAAQVIGAVSAGALGKN
jgi:hypothetical protein